VPSGCVCVCVAGTNVHGRGGAGGGCMGRVDSHYCVQQVHSDGCSKECMHLHVRCRETGVALGSVRHSPIKPEKAMDVAEQVHSLSGQRRSQTTGSAGLVADIADVSAALQEQLSILQVRYSETGSKHKCPDHENISNK